MRNLLSLLCLIVFLGLALPAQAQLREAVPLTEQAPAKLYGQEGPAFSLNKLFSPAHFQMNHSYEMSFGSYGGNTSTLGMYTNTMRWQFSDALAARVDVAVAHSPFGDVPGLQSNVGASQGMNGKVFIRNAELAFRPSENMRLHISFQQSPFGRYMNPYGRYGYSPYYGGAFGHQHYDLFWNDGRR